MKYNSKKVKHLAAHKLNEAREKLEGQHEQMQAQIARNRKRVPVMLGVAFLLGMLAAGIISVAIDGRHDVRPPLSVVDTEPVPQSIPPVAKDEQPKESPKLADRDRDRRGDRDGILDRADKHPVVKGPVIAPSRDLPRMGF